MNILVNVLIENKKRCARRISFVALSITALATVAVTSCTPIREQLYIRSQEPPRLPLAADSAPTGGLPVKITGTELQALSNPLEATPESIKAGQTVFKTYCVMCHGEDGRGSGPVGRYFVPPPADLTAPVVGQLSDGQLFGFISGGIGRMPPFNADLTEEQRWQLVNYVRTLSK